MNPLCCLLGSFFSPSMAIIYDNSTFLWYRDETRQFIEGRGENDVAGNGNLYKKDGIV